MVAAITDKPKTSPQQQQQQPEPQQRRRPPVNRVAIWGPLLVVLALALLLIAGIWRHIQQKRAQQDFAAQTSKVMVDVVKVKRDEKPHELMLPGNITPMLETTIYARANGYVGQWLVDIGDVVKEGQVLAILETPELDQQLAAAQNTLKQNQANFELSRVTAQRWKELAAKQVVSKQDNDDRQSNYQASAAGVDASKANVAQLEQLQGFKKVIAPFAGKITSRKIDTGSLVSEGSGTTGTALFTLAQVDPLRIFVNVPQADAPLIEVGMDAKIFVQERANRDFTGKVTRTAGALDPTSRTLLTEVQIPNSDGALFAGMYAQVKFTVQDKEAPIIIPANVFVFRPTGTQVATLTPENKIHWQDIQVGQDFGNYMEVLRGLDADTQVVMNPTDDLTEGLEAHAKPPEKKQDGQPDGQPQKQGQQSQDNAGQSKTK